MARVVVLSIMRRFHPYWLFLSTLFLFSTVAVEPNIYCKLWSIQFVFSSFHPCTLCFPKNADHSKPISRFGGNQSRPMPFLDCGLFVNLLSATCENPCLWLPSSPEGVLFFPELFFSFRAYLSASSTLTLFVVFSLLLYLLAAHKSFSSIDVATAKASFFLLEGAQKKGREREKESKHMDCLAHAMHTQAIQKVMKPRESWRESLIKRLSRFCVCIGSVISHS